MAGSRIRFDGQVVIVSGAGRGMGRCHALLFAERGAHVVVNDIDQEVAEAVAQEVAGHGGSAIAAADDVADGAETIVRRALDTWGRVDVLVNNAGMAFNSRFDETKASEFDRVVKAHLGGTVNLSRAAWRALQATRGRIVNVSSNSIFGFAQSSAYAAAKAGIFGLTKALANESPPNHVRVNAIMPMARTRMFEDAGGETGSDLDRAHTRYFPPEAVSPFVVYLASPDIGFSGEAFEVAGGLVSRTVFAQGPTVEVRSPEDASGLVSELLSSDITFVGSLEQAMLAKLTALQSRDQGGKNGNG